MKNLHLILFILLSVNLLAQSKKIQLTSNEFTKDTLTKIVTDFICKSENIGAPIPPLMATPLHKKITYPKKKILKSKDNDFNMLPQNNTKGVYTLWIPVIHKRKYILFLYNDYIMIYSETEEHALLDELLNYTRLNKTPYSTYKIIAEGILFLFYDDIFDNEPN